MPPKGHLPFDLHVLGLPLAFILSQDQTLLCKFDILFFFLFCLYWIPVLELIRSLFFFVPYLSDFAWIIRSKNFRFNNAPSFPAPRSRCFASAKILLFPFRTTLSKNIFNLFLSFSLYAEP